LLYIDAASVFGGESVSLRADNPDHLIDNLDDLGRLKRACFVQDNMAVRGEYAIRSCVALLFQTAG
jgi:hypothetical protein